MISGYDKKARAFLLDHKLKIDRGHHYINRYAYLVNSFSGNTFQKLPPVTIPFDARKAVVQKKNGGTLIGFYFGGCNKKIKHYPVDMAANVVEHVSISPNHTCIFLGDSSEKETSDKLVSRLPAHGEYVNLTGQTRITELVDTIAALDLLVTVDSSPMHIAAAVGTPFIALVGKCPHSWNAVKPKVDFGHYVESSGEYIEDKYQMKGIPPETIIDKIFEILYSNVN